MQLLSRRAHRYVQIDSLSRWAGRFFQWCAARAAPACCTRPFVPPSPRAPALASSSPAYHGPGIRLPALNCWTGQQCSSSAHPRARASCRRARRAVYHLHRAPPRCDPMPRSRGAASHTCAAEPLALSYLLLLLSPRTPPMPTTSSHTRSSVSPPPPNHCSSLARSF